MHNKQLYSQTSAATIYYVAPTSGMGSGDPKTSTSTSTHDFSSKNYM